MSEMKIRAQAIKELEDQYGRVSAEQLVEAARDRKHALHNDFDWNDRQAAHKQRLHTARVIIASVRIVTKDTTRTITSPSYVRDPGRASDEQGYIATTRLRDDADASYEALLYESVRLQAQLERCREIAAALNLQDELQAVVDSVLTLSSRLRRGRSVPQDELRV